MLICSKCRFENPPENRFCQLCGASLLAATEEAESGQGNVPLAVPSQPTPASGPSGTELTELTEFSVAGSMGSDSPPTGPHETGPNETGPNHAATAAPSGADGAHPNDVTNITGDNADLPAPASVDAALPPQAAPSPQLVGSAGAWGLAPADPWLEGLVAEPSERWDESGQDESGQDESSQDESSHWDAPTTWAASSGEEAPDDDMPTVVLPMQLSRLESSGLTHTGRQRNHNEDNFDIYTEVTTAEGPNERQLSAKGLYILCDGMGGHSSGEVASAMVVQQLKAYFAEHWQGELPDEATIQAAIQAANWAVYEANEQNDSSGSGRMGTTLVLVLIQNTRVAFAHVGDSRLYTYTRRQGLEQRTMDHEVGQLEVMRGVEPEVAYGRPESFQLTQALGPKDNDYINPEIQFFELQEDTLFLLCSDGLSDYQLIEDHAAEKVEPLISSRMSLEQGVSDLVHLANDLSGHDNITAIAIRAKVRPDPRALR